MTPDLQESGAEWIAAWNERELERVLRLYVDDVVFTSPFAARLVPASHGTVIGIAHCASTGRLVSRSTPDLHFELVDVLKTVDGCTLLYTNQRGTTAAETMLFVDDGKVAQGIASHRE